MSATFATLIIADKSFGHSMNDSLCFFEVTTYARRVRILRVAQRDSRTRDSAELLTVTGPWGSVIVSLAYLLIRLRRRVVFPTPGGPTIVTSLGGGSSGKRSTRGTCNRFSLRSCDLVAALWSFPGLEKEKAFGLGPECFFFSLDFRCGLCTWSSMVASWFGCHWHKIAGLDAQKLDAGNDPHQGPTQIFWSVDLIFYLITLSIATHSTETPPRFGL